VLLLKSRGPLYWYRNYKHCVSVRVQKQILGLVQFVTMILLLLLSVYSQLYNAYQFMPSHIHFKYFQDFVDQDMQVLNTKIGFSDTYAFFFFPLSSFLPFFMLEQTRSSTLTCGQNFKMFFS